MGCLNSRNSIHPASQPPGQVNPCFARRSSVSEMQDLTPDGPNTTPELPRRRSGGDEMKPAEHSHLDSLLSWVESSDKNGYRPKLVRQSYSAQGSDRDEGYINSLETWRTKFSMPPQNLDQQFESMLEAELEQQDRPNSFFKHRGFPQRPVETQSQIDFFEMLDKKISEGPDYVPHQCKK